MIQGHCHCGAVSFEITETPQWLTRCNCSICRRLGALWAHLDIDKVEIIRRGAGTRAYSYGDKGLAFHSCQTCGCTTHWENLKPEEYSHMAVNFTMCDPDVVASFRVRNFDGADSWAYLD